MSDTTEQAPNTFGDYVKELRTGRHWTVANLAHYSKLNPSTITAIESGRNKNPSLAITLSLATALRVSLDDLLSFDASLLPPEEPLPPKTLEEAISLLADVTKRLEAVEAWKASIDNE